MIASPFSRPLYVMLKPAGSRCNLRCSYCYYLPKHELYPDGHQELSEDLLDTFIRQYLSAQTQEEVLFTWHGGEPLLRGIAFYRRALELQRRYGMGRVIDNCLQTNGTLLTPEWCEFFRDNNFLIGISIDGPSSFHDQLRSGSFSRVMKGIGMLNEYGVQWNAMAVVNSLNVREPLAFYRFFRDMGCQYLQFEPIVERKDSDGRLLAPHEKGGTMTEESVSAEDYGRFLCAIFDEWHAHDIGKMFVQHFEATLANMYGVPPGICSLAPTCGQAAAMEYNGDLYSCDHFVFPDYRLGNIRQETITEMMYGERQRQFGNSKYTTLPQRCKACRWLKLCYGECPKNRFTDDGVNYLCRAYSMFFAHAMPRLLEIPVNR